MGNLDHLYTPRESEEDQKGLSKSPIPFPSCSNFRVADVNQRYAVYPNRGKGVLF